MCPKTLPVDVERIRERRKLAPFEHRQPPGIVGAPDAHVVRHDVEQELKAVRLDIGRKALESIEAAKLGIDFRRIDGVVSVRRARSGP